MLYPQFLTGGPELFVRISISLFFGLLNQIHEFKVISIPHFVFTRIFSFLLKYVLFNKFLKVENTVIFSRHFGIVTKR